VISHLIKQTHEIMGSIKSKQTQIIKSIYQSIKQTHEKIISQQSKQTQEIINEVNKQLKNPD
jgi:uncharacterized membrane protein